MHSLTLKAASGAAHGGLNEFVDDGAEYEEDVLDDAAAIARAGPGDVVNISQPHTVNFEIDCPRPDAYWDVTIVRGRAVVPIRAYSQEVKSQYVRGQGLTTVKAMSHGVSLAASSTFYKAQGAFAHVDISGILRLHNSNSHTQTHTHTHTSRTAGRSMSRVLADLNQPTQSPYITFEAAFVFFSRVSYASHAKVLPLQAGAIWDHLWRLQPSKFTIAYLNGFVPGRSGFNPELAQAALEVCEESALQYKSGKRTGKRAVRGTAAAAAAAAPAAAAAVPGAPLAALATPTTTPRRQTAAAATTSAARGRGRARDDSDSDDTTPAAKRGRVERPPPLAVPYYALPDIGLTSELLRKRTLEDYPRVRALGQDKENGNDITYDMYNADVASVRGWLTTSLITFFFQLLQAASGGRFIALDAMHTTVMPGGSAPSVPGCTYWGRRLVGAAHLDTNIIACGHRHAHFMYFEVNHAAATILVADPLRYEATDSALATATAINNWLADERARLGRPAVAPYDIVMSTTHPRQADDISCGVFVCSYAYWRLQFDRLPTEGDDFAASHHWAWRMFLLECVLSRKLPMYPAPAQLGLVANGAAAYAEATMVEQLAAEHNMPVAQFLALQDSLARLPEAARADDASTDAPAAARR